MGSLSWLWERLTGTQTCDTMVAAPAVLVQGPERPTEWRRMQELRSLLQSSEAVRHAAQRCGLVYDEFMQQHAGPEGHPEQPGRISEIWRQLGDAGLVEVCSRLPSRRASKKELMYVHKERHVNRVLNSSSLCANQFNMAKQSKACGYLAPPLSSKQSSVDIDEDTYMCNASGEAAKLAVGCVLSLVDGVMRNQRDDVHKDAVVQCGMAVVRPPGHHASADRCAGFCLFNNVAIAARYLQKVHGLKKILIVDWDVHHGDGTSDIFADDTDVLFFSLHRYDARGAFYPGTGLMEDTGKDPAKGYTVNVPLGQGYSDLDVCHVIRHVLYPLAERFQPEFVLVSAGFDAVHDDCLGRCHMTPQGFGWVTRSLYSLAGHFCHGRLLLVLEGGYNCVNIGRCAVECVGALVLDAAGEAPLPNALPPLPELFANGGSGAYQQNAWKWTQAPSMKTVNIVRKLTELHHLYALQLPLAPKRPDGMGRNSPSGKHSKKGAPLRKSQQRAVGIEFHIKEVDGDAQSEPADPGTESEVDSEQEGEVEHPIRDAREVEPPTFYVYRRRRRPVVHDWRLWAVTFLLFALFWEKWDNSSNTSQVQVERTKRRQDIRPAQKHTTGAAERHKTRVIKMEITMSFKMLHGMQVTERPTRRVRLVGRPRDERDTTVLVVNARAHAMAEEKKKEKERLRKERSGKHQEKKMLANKEMDERRAQRKANHRTTTTPFPKKGGRHEWEIEMNHHEKYTKTRQDKKRATREIGEQQSKRLDRREKKDAKSDRDKLKHVADMEIGSYADERDSRDSWRSKKDEDEGERSGKKKNVENEMKGMDDIGKKRQSDPHFSRAHEKQQSCEDGIGDSKTCQKSGDKTKSPTNMNKKKETKSAPTLAPRNTGFYVKPTANLGAQEVFVYIPISRSVKSKDVTAKITRKHLQVNVKGKSMIDGELTAAIDSEDSFWEIGSDGGKRCIRVTLRKADRNDEFVPLFSP